MNHKRNQGNTSALFPLIIPHSGGKVNTNQGGFTMKTTFIPEITNSITEKAISIIEQKNDRSAWGRAVRSDAIFMIDNIQQAISDGEMLVAMLYHSEQIDNYLLNGAKDWNEYSWGGCALIYDSDIAKRYCTPSELKKTKNGERRPNASEEWLDVQARALFQASNRVKRAIKQAITELEAEYGDNICY